MSPGFLSDRRAVIAIIIGAILAIVAYFVVRPIDTTISYVVFGVAALLFVYACVMDIADEFEPAEKPKPKPKAVPEPEPEPEPEEEHAELHVPAVEEPAAPLTDLPIESIEGIGPVYGGKLRDAGFPTVLEMVAADPEKIATICDVSTGEAERWIAMCRFSWLDTVSEEDAEAIVFATGMEDLKSLAKADAGDLYKKIEVALAEGDVRVPAGYKFSVEQIQKWIDEAKSLV
jgi:predicted flap endonuclease-1-like 5' DNA nuclease